ncbi:hypothetical protein ACFO1B_16505 [Dactylosporangium siamense]|uniref:Uncharacterized protein n=1 Tax=Dactylosporangium siamense TaxID=685454 RepID=A0A919U7E5_9ACTN|nr:hypothetical protein [Dactylosporangium siamense]GIG45444.1 hypothetical protein Dsi01nite_034850 [Dactylosporangium siamense]
MQRLDEIERQLHASEPGAPARRLSRLLADRAEHNVRTRSAPLLDLVSRLGDRLRADGVPVTSSGGPWSFRELDVYDLFVAEDIPFELEPPNRIPLADWFADGEPGRRPLLALGTHPLFTTRFRRECVDLLGSHSFGAEITGGQPLHPNLLARALAVPGVAAMLAAEVDVLTAAAAAAPIGELKRILHRLGPLRTPAGYAAFGPLLDRLATLDPADALSRTLRCGIPVELAWPAYVQAFAGLDPAHLRTDQDWPLLAIHDNDNAVVLGPSGVIARYHLNVPERDGIEGRFQPRCTLHGGRLLVSWRARGTEVGYWADTLDVVLDVADVDAELAGIVVGPATRPPTFSDVVPGGRFEPVPDGGPVRRRWRRELPAGAPAAFGAVDGETGWDVIDTAGMSCVRSVDGRQVPLPATAVVAQIAGVLRLPGGADRLVTADPFGAVTIWDPVTGTPAYGPDRAEGMPPVGWWDLLGPRDQAASAAMRAGGPLPPATDPVLVAGVERQATIAADLTATVHLFRALRHLPPSPLVPAHADDATLTNAVAGLAYASKFGAPRRSARADLTAGYRLMDLLHSLPAALRGGSSPRSAGVRGWSRVVGGLGALALRAGMATTPAPEREALATLLTALADAGLADGTAGLSMLTVVVDDEFPGDIAAKFDLRAVVAEGIHSGLGRSCHRVIVRGAAPERDGLQVVERTPLGAWGTTGSVQRFVDLLAERGPVTWRPEWAAPAATAVGVRAATATALLTGALYAVAADDVVVPADYLAATGLTARRERAASRKLGALPPGRLLHLLNAAMPTDPETLWRSGPDVARLAAAWNTPSPTPYEP